MLIDRRLALRPSLSLAMLACVFTFMMVATSLLLTFMGQKMTDHTAMLRIGAILQDTFIFIIPAIVTALISTRYPAWFLEIEHFPEPKIIVATLLLMLLSIPAMNFIVEWNSNLDLPESLSGIAIKMREMEDAAQKSVEILLGGSGAGSLIMAILIVGVYAGFSEELFFRGALQRLLGFRYNRHVAIWLTAFIFSAFHLQFFGFFPRLLLGAFFGYLMVWSGSLWLPVIAHVFNNSLVALIQWIEHTQRVKCEMNNIGTDTGSVIDVTMAVLSLILIVCGIIILRRMTMGTTVKD